ncbi:MAG: hypothetical protein ACLUGD_11770 [Ruminococcus sp.]
MAIEYLGLSEINGPLVLEGVKNAPYEEIVSFRMMTELKAAVSLKLRR